MAAVSVVIIAKNEVHVLGETIKSVVQFTDDIIVVDSGSTDGSQHMATSLGAKVIDTSWKGFGPTKNLGIDNAKYDWILSIDADEQPDNDLKQAIFNLDFSITEIVYNIKFKTYLGGKLIRFGEWGNDEHVRLFNKNPIRWNDAEVHEKLLIPDGCRKETLNGFIHHYTMKDVAEYSTKMSKYALLGAELYFKEGKKSTWVKRNISPRFSFIANYFFKLGFLDGKEGYLIAKMTMFYTYIKYMRLYELQKNQLPS